MSGSRISRRVVLVCAAAFIAIACIGVNAANALRYATVSFGDPARAPLTDVAGLSQHRAMSELETLQAAKPPGVTLSDAAWSAVGKLEQAYTFPTPILFFSLPGWYQHVDGSRGPLGNFSLGSAPYRSALASLIERHTAAYRYAIFPGPPGETNDAFVLDDRIPAALRRPGDVWLMQSPNPTLFNTRNAPLSYDVTRVPWSSVHDRLVLIPSVRASAGIFDRPPRGEPSIMVARYEPDPLIPGGKVEAVGRYMLFAVVNPSPKLRVVVDFTASLNADGSNRVPPISVLGTRREAFAVEGRGAGRFVSPPIVPRLVDGLPMFELDMGADGTVFRQPRRGILALFGSQYKLDPRRFVGFVRDISVISDEQYRRLRAPSALTAFPRDLQNPDLQFSGIYEDGWVAERAFAWLTAPRGRHAFVVRGSVPALPGVTESVVHVSIDGIEVASQPVLPGEFEIRADSHGDGRRHKVDLVFDRTFHLPNGDNRVAAGLLSYAGYE